MNILILEDELPAYKKLLVYLTHIFGDKLSHSHARTVKSGIAILSKPHTFELILSDIKLLDGTSFEVFDQVAVAIPIIFCTAYDTHLLEAFRTNGIAYILKPFSQEEIEHSIEKYQTLFPKKSIENSLFDDFQRLLIQERNSYKKRFAIKKKQGIHLLQTQDINFVEAFGDLSRIIDKEGRLHTVSTNIGALIQELAPEQFFRINRSQIVHIKYIEKIEPYTKNRLALFMTGQKEAIYTSTTTTKAFRKWLEH